MSRFRAADGVSGHFQGVIQVHTKKPTASITKKYTCGMIDSQARTRLAVHTKYIAAVILMVVGFENIGSFRIVYP